MIYALKMFSDFVEGKGTNDRQRRKHKIECIHNTHTHTEKRRINLSSAFQYTIVSVLLFKSGKNKQTNKTLKKQKRQIRGNQW